MYELVLEAFLKMPLKTIIGNYKMPLYVDIGRRFEKMPQKTF